MYVLHDACIIAYVFHVCNECITCIFLQYAFDVMYARHVICEMHAKYAMYVTYGIHVMHAMYVIWAMHAMFAMHITFAMYAMHPFFAYSNGFPHLYFALFLRYGW